MEKVDTKCAHYGKTMSYIPDPRPRMDDFKVHYCTTECRENALLNAIKNHPTESAMAKCPKYSLEMEVSRVFFDNWKMKDSPWYGTCPSCGAKFQTKNVWH